MLRERTNHRSPRIAIHLLHSERPLLTRDRTLPMTLPPLDLGDLELEGLILRVHGSRRGGRVVGEGDGGVREVSMVEVRSREEGLVVSCCHTSCCCVVLFCQSHVLLS